MSIGRKIVLYFALTIPLIVGIAFMAIYFLFAENREESFQMRQKDKITSTLKLLSTVKDRDDDIIEALDKISVNEIYHEKLLLFNSQKQLIYSNIVDIPVPVSGKILARLNAHTKWIETKDGLYDVVGTYIKRHGKTYYGISKALDDFGYSKLRFLKYTLIFSFLIITLIILIVSVYISRKISNPLEKVTHQISTYHVSGDFTPLAYTETQDEIAILVNVFNQLMQRMNDAFAFQKHVVHHISHELKTPIAVLVSNFERIEKEQNPEKLHELIRHQKEDTRSLGEIINSLLEIAKLESGNDLHKESLRIDELIFDISDKLRNVYPDFVFSVEYTEPVQEKNLHFEGSLRLLNAAFANLMENCIRYSSNQQATIRIETQNGLRISFENQGDTLNPKEVSLLFNHFFRGKNSKGKRGFGLGLVFVHKIITLHHGTIGYESWQPKTNTFRITLF